ncbi:MAG: DUF3368 domain-containing protein [Prevotellaceae bacterium]|jgi:predicted nucleic acid-binding protein|nr:DUF3368 domain-containing protein [Prevotellaceae bacterium]
MVVVCDSSPVVALATVDKLGLLDALFHEVVIPRRVFEELTVPDKPEAEKIRVWAQAKVVAQAANSPLVRTLNMLLDAGESEAMALYWERKASYLLIDEKRGRRIAAQNEVRVVGTFGILLMSKQRGLIATVKPVMDLLRCSAIRFSDKLYHAILELAGEQV